MASITCITARCLARGNWLIRRHEKQAILAVHRNAQRLLRSLAAVNPYADQLTLLDDRTRTRRDHDKYLTLIDTIALLHQHQRPIRSATVAGGVVEYIEVTLDDIALANRIAHEVLGRSLDELPPQTRRKLASVQALVCSQMAAQGLPQRDVRFTRAELRAASGLADIGIGLGLGAAGYGLDRMFAKPGNESRPNDAPTGTNPIDQTGLGRGMCTTSKTA